MAKTIKPSTKIKSSRVSDDSDILVRHFDEIDAQKKEAAKKLADGLDAHLFKIPDSTDEELLDLLDHSLGPISNVYMHESNIKWNEAVRKEILYRMRQRNN